MFWTCKQFRARAAKRRFSYELDVCASWAFNPRPYKKAWEQHISGARVKNTMGRYANCVLKIENMVYFNEYLLTFDPFDTNFFLFIGFWRVRWYIWRYYYFDMAITLHIIYGSTTFIFKFFINQVSFIPGTSHCILLYCSFKFTTIYLP